MKYLREHPIFFSVRKNTRLSFNIYEGEEGEDPNDIATPIKGGKLENFIMKSKNPITGRRHRSSFSTTIDEPVTKKRRIDFESLFVE